MNLFLHLIVFIFTVVIFAPGASAQNNLDSAILPASMTWHGMPISPLCFRSMNMEADSKISLYNCELGLNVENKSPPESLTQRRTYDNDSAAVVGHSTPFYEYTYLGNITGGSEAQYALLLLRWSGGGTGQFSALATFEREDDFFYLRELIAQGDRCNHGISKVDLTPDGKLRFKQNLTPYDLFEIGGAPDRKILDIIRPYSDLKSCAACCYGTAEFIDQTLKTIELDAEALSNIQFNTDKFAPKTKQECFDKALMFLTHNGNYSYSFKAWEVFIKGVEDVCYSMLLKNPSSATQDKE